MSVARQALGRRGEALAARVLTRQGWRVIGRNVRVSGMRGEIDIVAIDGDTVVIVEVKTASSHARMGPVTPLELVGPKKQATLRSLAGAWAQQNAGSLRGINDLRIDVVGLRLDRNDAICEWIHVCAAC